MRAVLHHLQRTAVQAGPRVLGAVTGRCVAGMPRTETAEHPFRKRLGEPPSWG